MGVFSHVILIYAVVFKYSIMNVYLEVCMIKVEEILSTLSPNQKVNYDKVFQKWQARGRKRGFDRTFSCMSVVHHARPIHWST